MIISLGKICLVAVCLHLAAVSVFAEVNLIEPVVPTVTVEAAADAKGKLVCENGLEMQKSGHCCPRGTDNSLWSGVCTPVGTVDDQIFNGPDGTRFCPSSDMFIVSDKERNWISCAASDSAPMYASAKKSEGSEFCMKHGYGYLIRINPWGTVGCIKTGDSQGDGCIEAGTCSFVSGKK